MLLAKAREESGNTISWKYFLLVLPDNLIREHPHGDDGCEDVKSQLTSYSNCEFNEAKRGGRTPTDGSLNAVVTLHEGNLSNNCVKLGCKIVPVTTAYVSFQVAIDGTQVLLKYDESEDEELVDPDEFWDDMDALLQKSRRAWEVVVSSLEILVEMFCLLSS